MKVVGGNGVASSASERADGNAINIGARNCGSLAIECSDVSGYVAGVSDRISSHLKTLDTLEEVTSRLMDAQARVAESTAEARLLAEQAREKLGQGSGGIAGKHAIFRQHTDPVVEPGERMADHADTRSHGTK